MPAKAIFWLGLTAALAAGAVLPPFSSAAPLLTGFTDSDAYGSAETRATALERTRAARASAVRLFVRWSEIAPVRPPDGAAARDPGWPGYRWEAADAVVRDVAAAGLEPLVSFLQAPSWAEGRGRPRVSERVPAGTWRPSPEAYEDFAAAAAGRYSGMHRDPVRPGRLPRIRYWQSWNEPNLTDYLTPQWQRRRGRWVATSPGHYRRMLNAFYSGVKGVDATNLVISAATAPFGDYQPGARRIPPAYFTRELLCVRGIQRPRAFNCADSPARFDALAHNPYPIGPPRRHAANPDDVVVPDFDRLIRPLAAARRAGKVAPRGPKQIWATEISWDSDPPDPEGVPARLHARYLSGALFVLWRQGVDAVFWYLLRDSEEGRGFEFGLQSGLFTRGSSIALDQPKPAYAAFRFPFVAYRYGSFVRPWGIAPAPGRVAIERRGRGGWSRVYSVTAGSDRVFYGRMRARAGTVLRARVGDEVSLSWEVVSGRGRRDR